MNHRLLVVIASVFAALTFSYPTQAKGFPVQRKPLLLMEQTVKKPALRDELLLNGVWDNNKKVPVYEGTNNFDQETYQRPVSVPAAWTGKIVKIEFGAVQFIADVFVNDRPVAHHVGGWSPFAVDVTRWVKPGATFTLKVRVQGAKHAPITSSRGSVEWPVGAWSNKGGIADDVFLRAYGPVYIEDTFIRTSFRDQTLQADYTLVNSDTKARTIDLRGDVSLPSGKAVEAVLSGAPITLQPGERKVVQRRTQWKNPTLWWPDAPVLYHLRSRIGEGSQTVDEETRRFGFREIWIEGNQFKLNGVRANLFGDYQSIDAGYHSSSSDLTPSGWPDTVDKIKAMNIRVLRFHHSPMPQYLYDTADEKGLLICSEAANYAREYLLKSDKNDYIRNAITTFEPWIRSQRNHPSIYIWNATNEMTYSHLGGFSPQQCEALGEAIHALDPSRFVGYDGDAQSLTKTKGGVNGALINYHYPEGYNEEPKGSIYRWAALVHPSKPTGTGEMLHTRDSQHPEKKEAVERNQWWLGILLRGLRWANWTDVRPSCYWFAAKDLQNPDPLWRVRGENLRNALAPIALFDKAYDDLGIAPYVTGLKPGGVLPFLTSGTIEKRTLVLYNDDFKNTGVQITVQIRVDGREQARGTKTFTVALGEHREIPLTFHVPAREKETVVELVLQTAKNNTLRFEEIRRFRVRGGGGAGTTNNKESGVVLIGEAARVP